MIGGCTKIVQDVPPFTIVDGSPSRARGLNLVGMKRAGFEEDSIKAINSAYRKLYRKGLNTSQALAAIREGAMTPEVEQFVTFVETSQRGVVSAGRVE